MKVTFAVGLVMFGVLTLGFIFFDMTVPGLFSIAGMLACRYGMDTTK